MSGTIVAFGGITVLLAVVAIMYGSLMFYTRSNEKNSKYP